MHHYFLCLFLETREGHVSFYILSMIDFEYKIKVITKSDKVQIYFKIYSSNLNRKLSNFILIKNIG